VDVIVNADDLGMSAKINEAIFALVACHKITSCTIMANGPAFVAAAEKIHCYPQCSFGIHLNITEFQPLTTNADLGDVLDASGNFRKTNMHRRMGIRLMRAILGEWCAQIEKALSYGVKLSHIDSHDHVHVRKPQLIYCLKHLQKKYDISKIRISKNIYSSMHPIKSRALLYKKKLYNYSIKKFYPTKTTHGFTDLATFIKALRIKKISYHSVELMVHPGNPKQYFIDEIALLNTSWCDDIPIKVNLINYHEL
jgi:chitin disaccharide deacetylase